MGKTKAKTSVSETFGGDGELRELDGTPDAPGQLIESETLEGEAFTEPASTPTAWDNLQEYSKQAGYVDPFDAPAGAAASGFDLDEEIMIDTTGAATRGLPVGAYKARCVGIRPGRPSNAGDPCYIWTFQVMEGDHAGETMDQYTYAGPKTLWKFAETKFALGFGEKDAISPRKIMNRACIIVVGESMYQGKTRLSLDTVTPPQDRPYGSAWEGDPAVVEAPPF